MAGVEGQYLLIPLKDHFAGLARVKEREGFNGLFDFEAVRDDLIERYGFFEHEFDRSKIGRHRKDRIAADGEIFC